MMQEVIVAVIVAGAVWVVAKRYAPKSVQISARMWFARILKKLHLNGAASKLEAAAQARASASGCGSCGACSTAGATPAEKQFTITPEELKRTAHR
jgi:hypothetical protein